LHFNTLNGLIHNYISSTFLDSEGQQWLSTKRTSISFYDTKNEFFKTLKPDSINFGLNINGICEDYIGNIWFATNGNALLKFSNNEFRWIGNRNNTLSSQYCYSIKNDKFDNIWVSHRNGFSVYIPNDNRTIAFKSNQGFPEGSSINNSIIKLSNKNLLAVSGQNLVKINTALVNDNHSTPYVNIDKLLINGKEYYSQNEINLKYGNYTIDFSFVGLSFKKGSPLLFSYKLDGIDTKWSELTAHHQIKYLVNDYGTYVFRIKGINAYKQESDIKSYKIVIKKPFYLHYWFLILSSIAIIGTPALYTYIRFRNSIRSRQQLEQKVKERTLEILQKSREIEEQKEELAISKAQSDELLRQFEDTLENLEDVYFKTDRTFNYKQVSPSILKHLNIDSLDKVIGRPLIEHWEFWPGEDKKLFKKIIKNKSIKGLLIKYKATGGSLKYGKINARAIFKDGKFEAIEGYVRDVTSDIEYNKQIVDLNIQQELLINNIPSAIYYKDTDLKYIQVNNYFANLIGKEVVDIIGYSDSDLVDSKTREEFEELNKQVIETKKPLYNYIRETRSNEGDMLWISTTMVPIIGQENKAEGVIGVIQDITERIEYENKLKESKETLEQIHNDLSDNINYAKSIQEALFTSDNIIDSFLNDYFIMFQPRDNVSGDFYYVNKFEDSIIIAAADCTGHGVSGAFLTVLGITFLHDIVSRNDINDPGSVLDQLREKVKETYKTFGSNRNDGLDIALCVLNTKTKELSYSGAYNPLWIVRENKLIEYKATRNPIGVYVNEKEFEVHNIQLIEGDSFYIFSDGYADQFGGENGKKFKYDPLKKLIIKNSSLPMKKQKDRLVENFNQWKGKNDQVDDVTFIGVKV
jgi:PAS domain S-box-containing protein